MSIFLYLFCELQRAMIGTMIKYALIRPFYWISDHMLQNCQTHFTWKMGYIWVRSNVTYVSLGLNGIRLYLDPTHLQGPVTLTTLLALCLSRLHSFPWNAVCSRLQCILEAVSASLRPLPSRNVPFWPPESTTPALKVAHSLSLS